LKHKEASKAALRRSRRLGSTHPGEIVAEEMEVRGLTAVGFAAELGCPMSELDGVLVRTLPMTPALAATLERAWGAEAEFWMQLQAQHDHATRREW